MKTIIKNKKFLAIYITWIFIHSTLLFLGEHGSTDKFWPFADSAVRYTYDISEWFVYVCLPLVIIILINSFNDKS